MKHTKHKINKLYLLSSLLNAYINENNEDDKAFIVKEIEEIERIAREISCDVSDCPYS